MINKLFSMFSRKKKKISIGICAMEKKSKSKPMQSILEKINKEIFEIIFFTDDMILNTPIETWPQCDVLIAFYSTNYPTAKVLEYIKQRNPFCINDLSVDEVLKDRRKMYKLLLELEIDVPTHYIVNRNEGEEDNNIIEEFDEHIIVNGNILKKPFVEKPVDAENHNIYIYYPISAGGGSKRLFRKVNNRSSEFYPHINEIRRSGSYIYEEFVITQGTDVKVYTVGDGYGHAEARKSPVVDGRVKRDSNGREVRYPVMLNNKEKEMAKKIVINFRQFICGFDILRVHGKSYCCDVNGFSFVKNSKKYYEDASNILQEYILNFYCNLSQYSQMKMRFKMAQKAKIPSPISIKSTIPINQSNLLINSSILPSNSSHLILNSNTNEMSINSTSSSKYENEELRCVLAILRHSDRTPKQKIKFIINNKEYLSFFSKNSEGSSHKDLKVKSQKGLVSFLKMTKSILKRDYENYGVNKFNLKNNDEGDFYSNNSLFMANQTKRPHNYSPPLSPMPPSSFSSFSTSLNSNSNPNNKNNLINEFMDEIVEEVPPQLSIEIRRKLIQVRDVLERWEISGINRKLQMKPQKWEDDVYEDIEIEEEVDEILPQSDLEENKLNEIDNLNESNSKHIKKTVKKTVKKLVKEGKATELLIILKWGGDITSLGRTQAEELGQDFRDIFYPDHESGGVLRLHSTFRHDLKIYASDEGRVMKTAAAFTKGLLELEGQLTPILASLVTIEEKNHLMLDRGGNFEIKQEMDKCKKHLNLLQVDSQLTEDLIDKIAPNCSVALKEAMLKLGNPIKTLKRIHELIGIISKQLKVLFEENEFDYTNNNNNNNNPTTNSNSTLHPPNLSRSNTPLDLSLNLMDSNELHGNKTKMNLIFGSLAADICSAGIDNEEELINIELDKDIKSNDEKKELSISRPLSPLKYSDLKNNLPLELSKEDLKPPLLSTTSSSDFFTPLNPIIVHEQTPQNSSPAPIPVSSSLMIHETYGLMYDRWEKLFNDFFIKKSGLYDLTKIPDVFDMVRYDLIHNSSLKLTGMKELLNLSTLCESSIVPQEYGIDRKDKRYIGSKMCGALIEKIRHDLLVVSQTSSVNYNQINSLNYHQNSNSTDNCQTVSSLSATSTNSSTIESNIIPLSSIPLASFNDHNPLDIFNSSTHSVSSIANESSQDEFLYTLDPHHAEELKINSYQRVVRSRFYFTSESHLQTILNILRYPHPHSEAKLSYKARNKLKNFLNIDYLSQIIIRLFENKSIPNKFTCEISFSPGYMHNTEEVQENQSNSSESKIDIKKSIDQNELLQKEDDEVMKEIENELGLKIVANDKEVKLITELNNENEINFEQESNNMNEEDYEYHKNRKKFKKNSYMIIEKKLSLNTLIKLFDDTISIYKMKDKKMYMEKSKEIYEKTCCFCKKRTINVPISHDSSQCYCEKILNNEEYWYECDCDDQDEGSCDDDTEDEEEQRLKTEHNKIYEPLIQMDEPLISQNIHLDKETIEESSTCKEPNNSKQEIIQVEDKVKLKEIEVSIS